MGEVTDVRLVLTPDHPCSYLPDRRARTLFVSPERSLDTTLQSALSRVGFRRSGEYLYRPQCDACRACIPTRVAVQRFAPNRRQRRARQRNADLRIDLVAATRNESIYRLYADYIRARHADGDMNPPSTSQFDSFLIGTWSQTMMLRAHLDDVLVAVAVVDLLDDGVSAVYTFFDPAAAKRSLGTFMVLSEIELAHTLQLPYLYLGYWIEGCEKMNYKGNFGPQERLGQSGWKESGGREFDA